MSENQTKTSDAPVTLGDLQSILTDREAPLEERFAQLSQLALSTAGQLEELRAEGMRRTAIQLRTEALLMGYMKVFFALLGEESSIEAYALMTSEATGVQELTAKGVRINLLEYLRNNNPLHQSLDEASLVQAAGLVVGQALGAEEQGALEEGGCAADTCVNGKVCTVLGRCMREGAKEEGKPSSAGDA